MKIPERKSKLVKFKQFITKKSVLIVAAVLTVLLTLVLTRIEQEISGPSGAGIVYLELAFSREIFMRIISLWGEYGANLFIKTIWIDYIYPIAYSFLIAGGLAITEFKMTGAGKVFSNITQKIYLLPFLAAIFDFIENSILIYIVVNSFFNEYIILASSIISSIKWFLIIFSLAVFLKRYFAFRKIMKAQM